MFANWFEVNFNGRLNESDGQRGDEEHHERVDHARYAQERHDWQRGLIARLSRVGAREQKDRQNEHAEHETAHHKERQTKATLKI